MFCGLPAVRGRADKPPSLGSTLLATSHLLKCSPSLPAPQLHLTAFQLPCALYGPLFPHPQTGTREVRLAVQGFLEDFHLREPR